MILVGAFNLIIGEQEEKQVKLASLRKRTLARVEPALVARRRHRVGRPQPVCHLISKS